MFFREEMKVMKGTLLTFINSMRQFRLEKVSCLGAMTGNPEATIGLPSNTHPRANVIENMLSGILEDECVDGIKQGTNAEEMTRYLVNLSKQLSMGDWLVTNEMEPFNRV